MKFLAMSKRMPGVADAEVTKHGEAEALAVFRLMQAGIFDQINYSADWKGVLFLRTQGHVKKRRRCWKRCRWSEQDASLSIFMN